MGVFTDGSKAVVRPLEIVFAKHKIIRKYPLCVKEKINFK